MNNSKVIEEIQEWIVALKSAERGGAMNDKPEGSRYIQISDTLAINLVESLQAMQVLLHSLHVTNDTEEEAA